MTAKDPNQELNPYPVTRAYMEETDFPARVKEIRQEIEEKRKRVITAKLRRGLELDEEEAAVASGPGFSTGP